MIRKILLICGVLSSLLYISTDILAATRLEGYSYIDQAVSELTAIGAPTRSFVIPLYIVFDALTIAFGIGIWVSAGRKRALFTSGILLSAYGVVGLVGVLFFPMSPRGAEGGINDIGHLIVIGVTILLILGYIGFGAAARGKGFRIYSIVTILATLVSGALAGMQGPRIAAGLPTPWFGVIERVTVYSTVLWVLVIAVVLLRDHSSAPTALVAKPTA